MRPSRQRQPKPTLAVTDVIKKTHVPTTGARAPPAVSHLSDDALKASLFDIPAHESFLYVESHGQDIGAVEMHVIWPD